MTAAVTDAVRRRLDEVRGERGYAGIDLERADQDPLGSLPPADDAEATAGR